MSKIIKQIVLINRVDNRHYYLSKNYLPTLTYKNALCVKDELEIIDIIKRYYKAFKIIIITKQGEVIKKIN